MTQDEIIEIVREVYGTTATEQEIRFAKLVAEAEREACAKLCDYVYDNIVTDEHIKDMAYKIRARGQA